MFLDLLRRRNPRLIDAAVSFHNDGLLPANTYVLDLDAISANARVFAAECVRLELTPFAMTKQIGRNPDVSRALIAAGLTESVAVDMECARATTASGMQLGHVGHLVQVSRSEADEAAGFDPRFWTVFSFDKAREAGQAALRCGRKQPILARIYDPDDRFYPGHEGGFPADSILDVAAHIDSIPGARFAGITTFPAQRFDAEQGRTVVTHNLATVAEAAQRLRSAGWAHVEVNAPGTTSTGTLDQLAHAGATQVEPGHALTGTTPWHAVVDLPELPAICYLSEISHFHDDRAYCFGGGLYVDPVFPPYQIRALAGKPGSLIAVDATLPPPEAIDYYGQLNPDSNTTLTTGDAVVFGFRAQAFVTRAYTAAISGLDAGEPKVAGIWSADGSAAVRSN